MDAWIVGSGNIGATAAPFLGFSAYLSLLSRADERTRTAFLLITSDESLPHIRVAFFSEGAKPGYEGPIWNNLLPLTLPLMGGCPPGFVGN